MGVADRLEVPRVGGGSGGQCGAAHRVHDGRELFRGAHVARDGLAFRRFWKGEKNCQISRYAHMCQ